MEDVTLDEITLKKQKSKAAIDSLISQISKGLVPRLGFGKLKYHENSILRDLVLPYLPRGKRFKFLYGLSRSSRLYIARHFTTLMMIKEKEEVHQPHDYCELDTLKQLWKVCNNQFEDYGQLWLNQSGFKVLIPDSDGSGVMYAVSYGDSITKIDTQGNILDQKDIQIQDKAAKSSLQEKLYRTTLYGISFGQFLILSTKVENYKEHLTNHYIEILDSSDFQIIQSFKVTSLIKMISFFNNTSSLQQRVTFLCYGPQHILFLQYDDMNFQQPFSILKEHHLEKHYLTCIVASPYNGYLFCGVGQFQLATIDENYEFSYGENFYTGYTIEFATRLSETTYVIHIHDVLHIQCTQDYGKRETSHYLQCYPARHLNRLKVIKFFKKESGEIQYSLQSQIDHLSFKFQDKEYPMFFCQVIPLKVKNREFIHTLILREYDKLYLLTVDNHGKISQELKLISLSEENKYTEDQDEYDVQNHVEDHEEFLTEEGCKMIARYDKSTNEFLIYYLPAKSYRADSIQILRCSL